jgi:hypothetical protein
MTIVARLAASIVLILAGSVAIADVVVLKGGAVINIKKPPEVRGTTVLLTRADGTLLSVRATDIDREATSAARSAAAPAPAATPVPPATLAGAARAAREVPKARVRISDADVSHSEAAGQAAGEAAGEPGPEVDASAGSGRVEVADYTQEKSGEALVVRGTIRNPGATPATNVRMTVAAIDTKGQAIASGEAGVSNGVILPSSTVAFSVTIPVGARPVGSIRFSPRWMSAAAPPPASGPEGSSSGAAAADPAAPAAAASPAPAAKPTAPPAPAPTPFGRGNLYAPSAPNAPAQAPTDGKTGYLPGASHPANQPKPPD